MIKKIINLTKVFCGEYILKISVLNKKNILFWLIIIINIILGFLTQKCVSFLGSIGQGKIFLEIFFLIFNMIISMQTILSCANIFYFSKDIENILPLPIKPIELLISKFNILVIMAYIAEIFFCAIPLLIYGIMMNNNIFYFLWLFIILIIFPIFIILIITSIMLVTTNLIKFIKNKNTFQIVLTSILFILFIIFQIYYIKNISINNIEQQINNNNIENIQTENMITEINKNSIIINPCIQVLNENNNFNNIISIIKIILIESILFIMFFLLGNKLYFKNLINNISKINTKNIKNKYKKNRYKKINKNIKYVRNEFKSLINNPTFLMQCVVPTLLIGIILGGLIMILFPTYIDMIKFETQIQDIKIEFNFKVVMAILGIMQLIFIFSNISLTVITRKGKNAIFIKYIPIHLYKQFLLLNIPQILFNNFSIIIVLSIMKYCIPTINIFNFLILFILSNLLNIINSLTMLIVDLKRPNLNWNNETTALKENSNKLFHYILTIIIILFLIYLNKLFNQVNFNISIILTIIILMIIISIINLYVKKNIKKIFEKIF